MLLVGVAVFAVAVVVAAGVSVDLAVNETVTHAPSLPYLYGNYA